MLQFKNTIIKSYAIGLFLTLAPHSIAMEQSWFGQFKTATSDIWKRSLQSAAKNITKENIQEHKKEIALGATALAGIGIFAYVTRRIKNRANIQLQRELEKNAAASFALLEKQHSLSPITCQDKPSETTTTKEDKRLVEEIEKTINNPADQASYRKINCELENNIENRNQLIDVNEKLASLTLQRSQLHQKSSFSLFVSSVTSLFSK